MTRYECFLILWIVALFVGISIYQEAKTDPVAEPTTVTSFARVIPTRLG
jgi:hypothetical protein